MHRPVLRRFPLEKDRAHLLIQTHIPDQACCRTQLLQSGFDLIRKSHLPEGIPDFHDF